MLLASTAKAHHIWILPDSNGKPARAIFSDTLKPDAPRLLDNIGQTRLWLRDAESAESVGSWKREEDCFSIPLPPRAHAIGGECIYGTEIHDHRLRQDVQPYLLVYYPKALLGGAEAAKPWPKLTLEIVPVVSDRSVRLQVLFKGQPAAGAEMIGFSPDGLRVSRSSDKQGWSEVPLTAAGLYGFRTRVMEDKVGKHEGRTYWEIRHYASLVLKLEPRTEPSAAGQ
jgi:hypothetical protein